MRVGHTARSDHSDHDLPNTEVRVLRAASSKKRKGLEEEGVDARIKEKEERWASVFPLSPLFQSCAGGSRRSPWWLMTLVVSLFFDGEIVTSYRWRDLQRSWMFIRQRVWGLL